MVDFVLFTRKAGGIGYSSRRMRVLISKMNFLIFSRVVVLEEVIL